MANEDLFHQLAGAMCGLPGHSHCILNTFIVLPCVALFVGMIPFVFQWFETDTAADAAMLEAALAGEAGTRTARSWKWNSRDAAGLGAGAGRSHARFLQSTPLSVVQAVCSLGLGLSAMMQLVFQSRGDIEGEGVYRGTVAWALASLVAWFLNGGAVLMRGWRREGVPDYLQSWCVVCPFTCVHVFRRRRGRGRRGCGATGELSGWSPLLR